MDVVTDVKNILNHNELLSILAESVYDPTPERLKQRAEKYMACPNTIICALNRNGEYGGVIVLHKKENNQIEILDFAVRKSEQRKGIGSKLIAFCQSEYNLSELIAETDDDAADFYKKIGFKIKPLGDKYGTGIN